MQPPWMCVASYTKDTMSFDCSTDVTIFFGFFNVQILKSPIINPFAALGRLTDQNIDKHLSSYAKSGIDLIIMERQP